MVIKIYKEEYLTEWEILIQRNKIRNHEFLVECGFSPERLEYVEEKKERPEDIFGFLTSSDDDESSAQQNMKKQMKKKKKKKSKKNNDETGDDFGDEPGPSGFICKKKENCKKIEEEKRKKKMMEKKREEGTSTNSRSCGGKGKRFVREKPRIPVRKVTDDDEDDQDDPDYVDYSEPKYPSQLPVRKSLRVSKPVNYEDNYEYQQVVDDNLRPYDDTVVPEASKVFNRAYATLPDGLMVNVSSIKGAGWGYLQIL